MSEHKGKKKQNPQAAAREANTQQLTELKYLKSQLAQKNATIEQLQARVTELETAMKDATKQAQDGISAVLEQIHNDAEGQRPGKFAPAGTPVADVTQA